MRIEDIYPDRQLNRHGRPDNWADTTADRLLDVYLSWGKDAANTEWLEIVERDKPKQADANVALGRFNALLKAGPIPQD
jgi:hypothetical protein